MKHEHLVAAIGTPGAPGMKRSLVSRLLPAWLLAVPPSVTKEDSKLYFTRLAVPAMGIFCHCLLFGLYLFIDVPSMTLVNAVSIVIFAMAALLVRSGRHYAGTAVSILEVSIHAPVATFLLGLNAGYLIFNFIVAMCAVLTYTRKETRERLVVLVYAFVSSAVTAFFTYGREPIIALATWETNTILGIICTSTYLALVGFAYHFAAVSDRAEMRVEQELARSETLLLNVLPAEVAERLKKAPGTIADSFAAVTVLFADIVGFTKLAETCPGSELVGMLNEVFSAFDRVAETHGLEKIKTIGDAYMVVGGVPRERSDHAVSVVLMALEMAYVLRVRNKDREAPIEIRIGIHSGPVVAGVIGERKFAYDLWGDTVNTASRMESHGLPGQVQISDQTAALVKNMFDLEDRGIIEIKGKGPVRTWLVKGVKSELTSVDDPAATELRRAV